MKNTVCICYAPGNYGTYLEWCLTTLCTNIDVVAPFNNNGNSHRFLGNLLHALSGWQNYVASDFDFLFVRLHPKTLPSHTLNEVLTEIANDCQHVIFIQPCQQSVLLSVNNWVHKLGQDFALQYCPLDQIYKNWPIDQHLEAQKIPRWVWREFFSHWLMPTWVDLVEWPIKQDYGKHNIHTVSVLDLLYDFENTLHQIAKVCNLTFQKPVNDLLELHKINLDLQQFKNQDQLVPNIVDCVLAAKDFSWGNLPLPSEAWVQWQLRNHGVEIQCHGLDIFPTNSLQLRALTLTP